MTPNRYGWAALAALLVLAQAANATSPYRIPPEKSQRHGVLRGSSEAFTRAGEVDFKRLLVATYEHKLIIRDRIRKGSAMHVILLSRASKRISQALTAFSGANDYDLIATRECLRGLEQSVDADDVTQQVVAMMLGDVRRTKK